MKSIEFGNYKTYYIGKLLSCSKIAHLWIIYLNGKKIPIEAKESKISKKFCISINQKNLLKTKFDKFKEKNGLIFFNNNLKFKIIKEKWNKMNLYINDFIFVPGQIINLENKIIFINKNFDQISDSEHSSESQETLITEKFNNKNFLNDFFVNKKPFKENAFKFESENGHDQLN